MRSSRRSFYMKIYIFRPLIIILFCCSLTPYLRANTNPDTDIYRPPTSSGHCKLLTGKREQKLKTKQNLRSLLERNTRLFRSTPVAKKSIKRKLEFNRSEIRFKLKQNLYQIQTLEEKIIRKGCPGILSITIS